jgi:hypothetical protein
VEFKIIFKYWASASNDETGQALKAPAFLYEISPYFSKARITATMNKYRFACSILLICLAPL